MAEKKGLKPRMTMMSVYVHVEGLREKVDKMNRAIDLMHQAQELIEEANQVPLEVVMADPATRNEKAMEG